MVTSIAVARYLGPDAFGTLSVGIAWASLLGIASFAGAEAIFVRDMIHSPASKRTILGAALRVRLGMGALGTLLCIASAIMFSGDEIGRTVTTIVSFSLLFGAGDYVELSLQSKGSTRTIAIVRLCTLFIACAARWTLLLMGANLTAFAFVVVIESALLSMFYLMATRAGSEHRIEPSKESYYMTRVLCESWPNIISGLAMIAYMRMDRLMLSILDSDTAAGNFAAASSLVEVGLFIPTAVVTAATPVLLGVASKNTMEWNLELRRLFRLLGTTGLCASLVACTLLGPLGKEAFGQAYTDVESVTAYLGGLLFFAYLGSAASPWYLFKGFTKLAMARHLGGMCINLMLNLALIPPYGAKGAAIATVTAFAYAHVFGNLVHRETRSLFFLQLGFFRRLNRTNSHPS